MNETTTDQIFQIVQKSLEYCYIVLESVHFNEKVSECEVGRLRANDETYRQNYIDLDTFGRLLLFHFVVFLCLLYI